MEIQGWKIINNNVLKEIECLKLHINKGCLSNIPPGAGTNHNERLHCHIRPHFSHTRLGLPLALALMTILLHVHNSRLMDKLIGTSAKPILYEPVCQPCSYFDFGIVDKKSSSDFVGSWNSRTPFCFDPYGLWDYQQDNYFARISFTIQEITGILQNAIHLYSLTKTMHDKLSSTSLVNYQFFLSCPMFPVYFFGKIDPQPVVEHPALDSLFASWRMKRVAIIGDGNCCFSAVAFGLINTTFTPSLINP